jgi:hypothetical protein
LSDDIHSFRVNRPTFEELRALSNDDVRGPDTEKTVEMGDQILVSCEREPLDVV